MTNPPITTYRRHADVAEIQLLNPPVNGLGHEVRQSLHTHLREALADPQVRAIVLTGAGRMFCGGADIRQFGTPKATTQPMLRDINRLIEAAGKPVIAAIHGNALGGGLELAMSCHYRIAATGTRLALPEVKLGILPGGGGTQRLPRLVGVETALDLIVSGEAIDADKARACGLLDSVASGDLLDAALSLARAAADEGSGSLPVTSARQVRFDGDAPAYFEAQRARITQTCPSLPAPLACLECLEASLTMPFEDALMLERAKIQVLVDSPESRELRRRFFAAREAAKPGA
ncbi:putative enoyl-CoA hydratase (plasmid) [Variovorax sp. SRS16]|uniref:enoyl-CoA hydratase/isomerase family protein n=1 Tax=Variovorax sp. SRS16 TaxID=282217 RepID=UPI0013191581|nr:enoyl-CoA hydratase/isomerase family protein [Variovorax sp. SRS16]VTU46436.1 putative enoyl-CoA hydratase [Variovorax sp. SRS16]